MNNVPTDYRLAATDGFPLVGTRWTSQSPRATVVIAHGINEHIGRYRGVAEGLTNAGFHVVGVDHRGHGRSDAGKPRTANIRRFDQFVDDYIFVIEQIRTETGLPVVSLGHSMGGLIAARAALRIQDRLDALILSGPALLIPTDLSGPMLKISLAVARLLPFLNAPSGGEGELSRDPAVKSSFRQDSLCIQDPVKLGIARQLYLLAEGTRARAAEIHLPLLVMHGEADQITSPDGSAEFVRNAQSPDKEFIAWSGDHHEIFNELDKDAVIDHMITWLDTRLPASKGR